jgi:hypothetical protein
MRSKYLDPNTLIRNVTNMIAQKQRTVCQAVGAKSSRHNDMALKMSCAPPKLIESVTVQFPTRLNQPQTQLAIGAHSGVDIIADQ